MMDAWNAQKKKTGVVSLRNGHGIPAITMRRLCYNYAITLCYNYAKTMSCN